MSLVNKEEIAKAIRSSKGINIEEILDEFKDMLKELYQTATEVEFTEHLGYDKYNKSDNSNYRNRHNKKTLTSKYGEFGVSIPRDRDGSFEPQLVKKRQTLIEETEDLILSLYTQGLSVKDILHQVKK